MTVHKVSRLVPSLLQHNRFANNGQVPSPAFFRRIAQAINHAATWHQKCWLFVSDDIQGLATGSASQKTVAYAAGVTGMATDLMTALIGIGKPDNSAASDPFVELKYQAHGGSLTSAGTAHYHGGDKASLTPADIHHAVIQWAVDPDTNYDILLEVNDYARLYYVTVVETPNFEGADDSLAGIVDPSAFVGYGDIENSAIQDLIEASNDMLRHGPHLFTWTRMDESWPSTSSASYENLWSTISPGKFQLDLSNHSSVNRPVHVVFGAHAEMDASGTNGVRLRNVTDGATIAEVNGFGTSAGHIKKSVTVTPSDIDGDDLELQIVGDGTNTITVHSSYSYQYEYDWSTPLTHSLILDASSNEYAAITNANQVGLDIRQTITLECSVNFTSTPTSGNLMTMVSKFDSAGNQRSYRLTLLNDSGTLKLIGHVSGNGTNSHNVGAAWTPSTGTWYHVAMSWDPGAGGTPADQFEIYVDGSTQTVSTRTDSGVTTIHEGGADLVIGSEHGGSTNNLDGKICDVRVWNAVRSAAEIAANDDRDVQLAAHLMGHWLKTDSYADETDYGNDLDQQGAVAFSTDTPY